MPGPHDGPPHDHPSHSHPPHAHPDHHPPEHPPHGHHGHPPHGPESPPPGAEWIENDRRRRSLDSIAAILDAVAEDFSEDGVTKIRETEIAPPEECWFTVRYERTPEGDMQILFETRWDPSEGPTRSGSPDDPFGDRIGTSEDG